MAVRAKPTKSLVDRVNRLVSDIGKTNNAIGEQQVQMERALQQVREHYGRDIDKLTRERDDMVVETLRLVLPHFAQLAYRGTRTIKLRAGQISLRDTAPALTLSDKEAVIIKHIRRLGGMRRFVKTKLVLDRSALKADPDFVARLEGAAITTETRAYIEPAKSQGEAIVRAVDTAGLTLPSEED